VAGLASLKPPGTILASCLEPNWSGQHGESGFKRGVQKLCLQNVLSSWKKQRVTRKWHVPWGRWNWGSWEARGDKWVYTGIRL
jgi:hypothetical protein